MLKNVFFCLLLLFVAACSREEQPASHSGTVPVKTQGVETVAGQGEVRLPVDFKIVFFLNPNGGPCRIQLAILNAMADEFGGKVDVQYVQTTVPADQNIFYQYGIRALPTLLLADADGREIKRMSPGIKQADEIRLLLQSIPQS